MAWFLHAMASARATEAFDVTRAALATVSSQALPSVRFVLVKVVDARGFAFFTNHDSSKARDLAANPEAALAFHWHTTGQQIRVQGPVQRMSDIEADAYFETRPRVSQLGAWASEQSRSIADRAALDARFAALSARFPVDVAVPRPAQWGGYRLAAEQIEFWQDREGRLHDRWLFTRSAAGWACVRLQP
jgi:pyridoxamine 5'-phosphate oxidase